MVYDQPEIIGVQTPRTALYLDTNSVGAVPHISFFFIEISLIHPFYLTAFTQSAHFCFGTSHLKKSSRSQSAIENVELKISNRANATYVSTIQCNYRAG
jgi:hypothetical protein